MTATKCLPTILASNNLGACLKWIAPITTTTGLPHIVRVTLFAAWRDVVPCKAKVTVVATARVHALVLISAAIRRSLGNVVGEGNAGWFSPPFPVGVGLASLFPLARSPSRSLASIYLGARVLNHDQKAGCVEQPRHIRLQ